MLVAVEAIVPMIATGVEIALIVGALAVAGTAGAAAGGAFSSADSVDPPESDDPRAEAARRRTLFAEQSRKGRQASILTSGQGLLDEPTISKPVLLGK